MYEGVMAGWQLLFTWHNMFYLFMGIIVGILLGAIPGFNPSTAMVVLLPFTYFLEPATGIIFLSGVAGAAIYGGSITAILFRTPGTIGSIISVIDGYEMTRKGQGVQALGISGTASSIGGFFAGISLLLFAPPLAKLAMKFSFPEMFVLILWAFTVIGAVTGKLLKALAAGSLGMLLTSIGADPLNAYPRMTFDIPDLFEGINLITAIMGYFCFSEMMRMSKRQFILEDINKFQGGYREALKGMLFTLKRPGIFLRGSAIGIVVGALPAAGSAIANMISYAVQKSVARDPEQYGSGKPEGLLAAESANNATEGSCMIPTITLGIPGSNIAAILLAAMMLHGIVVGPRIFHDHGAVVYSLIFAIIIANPIMLILSFLMSKHLGRITVLPVETLIPYIMVFILIGTFAVRNSTFDFIIMVIFGVIAYFMQANGYSVTALVLPFVLGKNLEQSFLISMKYSANDPFIFFKGTICIVLWCLILITAIVPGRLRRKYQAKRD